MDLLSEDPHLTVELFEWTEHHTGLNRELGESVSYARPPDASHQESSKLLASIQQAAAQNGGKVETKSLRKSTPINHYDLGVTWSDIQTVVTVFGTGGAGWLFIKQCQLLLVQWLKNKESRSVKIKYGDLQVEVKGRNDVDQILKDLAKLMPIVEHIPKDVPKQKRPKKKPKTSSAKPKATKKGRKGKSR